MAKEYIILGDLNKSIKILSDSYFNDVSIQEWLVDAEILNKSKEKFEQLEISLVKLLLIPISPNTKTNINNVLKNDILI